MRQLRVETERQLASARGEVEQHKESTLALASCVEDTVAENMRLSGEVARLNVELAMLRGKVKEHDRARAAGGGSGGQGEQQAAVAAQFAEDELHAAQAAQEDLMSEIMEERERCVTWTSNSTYQPRCFA